MKFHKCPSSRLPPPETVRLPVSEAIANPDCSVSGPAREPPTGPRTGMDVKRFFLGVVFDGVSPEFTADTRLAITPERKLGCPIHECVDPDGSSANAAADADRGVDVSAPNTGRETVVCRVGQSDRPIEVVKRQSHDDRPKHLGARDLHRTCDALHDG